MHKAERERQHMLPGQQPPVAGLHWAMGAELGLL